MAARDLVAHETACIPALHFQLQAHEAIFLSLRCQLNEGAKKRKSRESKPATSSTSSSWIKRQKRGCDDQDHTFVLVTANVVQCNETGELLLSLSWLEEANLLHAFTGPRSAKTGELPPGLAMHVRLPHQGGIGHAYGSQVFFAHLCQHLTADGVCSPFSKRVSFVASTELDRAHTWFDQAVYRQPQAAAAATSSSPSLEAQPDRIKHEKKGKDDESEQSKGGGGEIEQFIARQRRARVHVRVFMHSYQ
jgi:hypothetical protein